MNIPLEENFSENEIWEALKSNQDGDAKLFVKLNKGRFCYDPGVGEFFFQSHDSFRGGLGFVESEVLQVSNGAEIVQRNVTGTFGVIEAPIGVFLDNDCVGVGTGFSHEYVSKCWRQLSTGR